jgi:GNAT superfamily N-acetyltransferase
MAELVDGMVVGFASYGELVDTAEPSTGTKRLAKLYKLYLLPELKGKGYGSALVNAVIARCGQTGYEQLNLSVNRGNPSVAFYQRQGFSVLKEEDIEVGPGFVRHDYVMGKPLS